MKIVVKHIDNLKSSLIETRDEVPQYLVYLMTDDDTSVSCDIVNGEEEKSLKVNWLQIENHLKNGTSGKEFTLPIYEVSYEDFKNNILNNTPTYVGN